MKKTKIKAVRSKDTIVLIYEGRTLNIQKSQKPAEWEAVDKLMKAKDMLNLEKKFLSISGGIKEFTEGNFTVDPEKREVYFQGDKTTPMPESLVKKLKEHYQSGVDFQPLIRFWKNCLKNPNEDSRKELFDFMLKNNIPLTEQGEIIVEKGVKRLENGTLVDCHSKSIDNSIGMIVRMPRNEVDSNRRNECSYGLHVAAPDYVRKWWSSDVILTCIVNPEHVVSVPQDYGSTKMRVCEYRVVGFADKCNINPDKLVFKLEDIFDVEEVIKTSKRVKEEPFVKPEKTSAKKVDVVESTLYTKESLEVMSIKAIKELIQTNYGVHITKKIKEDVIRLALECVEKNKAEASKEYKLEEFAELTKQGIIDKVKQDFGVEIQMKKKTRDQLIQEAVEVSKLK